MSNTRHHVWGPLTWLSLPIILFGSILLSCGEGGQIADVYNKADDTDEVMARVTASCNLPADPVDATHHYPGGSSFFDITLGGVGDGFDVADGTYPGWCFEDNGQPNTSDPVLLVCSYDPALPGNLGSIEWDKVNYLLNHKQGNKNDVQAAVWLLTWGSSHTLPVTPTALLMVEAAEANGAGFEPEAGDIIVVILYTGDGGTGAGGVQDTIIEVPVPPEDGACRVTSGGVDEFATGGDNGNAVNRYTFGGQAGAPTANQPQPYGEWTHHQQRGPDGRFTFHAGTASAPEGTEIDFVTCSDPGFCHPARPAPAKQIDFEGVGTFKNIRNPSAPLMNVVVGETFHWFEIHIEDLGEPGQGGRQDPPGDMCPPNGFRGDVGDCDCPDFYSITIYEGVAAGEEPNKTDVIYHVHGYLKGGNLQIHPAIQ